eukprot:6208333-Pleurochrysis_carterae.AAC.3
MRRKAQSRKQKHGRWQLSRCKKKRARAACSRTWRALLSSPPPPPRALSRYGCRRRRRRLGSDAAPPAMQRPVRYVSIHSPSNR